MREYIVGTKIDPIETGDMAYRATVPRDRVLALQDESLLSLCNDNALRNWIGPNMHAVLYPVRHGEELNLVLMYHGHSQPPNFPQSLLKHSQLSRRCPLRPRLHLRKPTRDARPIQGLGSTVSFGSANSKLIRRTPPVATTEPPGLRSLQKILSCVSSASKWKIRDGPELQSWTKVSPTNPS